MEKKIIEEKENMKVQQAAFDKILPGVQARCAVFFSGITYVLLPSYLPDEFTAFFARKKKPSTKLGNCAKQYRVLNQSCIGI